MIRLEKVKVEVFLYYTKWIYGNASNTACFSDLRIVDDSIWWVTALDLYLFSGFILDAQFEQSVIDAMKEKLRCSEPHAHDQSSAEIVGHLYENTTGSRDVRSLLAHHLIDHMTSECYLANVRQLPDELIAEVETARMKKRHMKTLEASGASSRGE